MKYLLDTHTLIWYLEDSPNLSPEPKSIIENPTNEIIVSIASFWEIAIKNSIGKLNLTKSLAEIIAETRRQNISIGQIEDAYLLKINNLPFHHRDPFDRLLVAACLHEKMPIVGKDVLFDAHGVKRIW